MGLCIGVKVGAKIQIENNILDVIGVEDNKIRLIYREKTYEVGQDQSIPIDSFMSIYMGKPSCQSIEAHKDNPSQELLHRLVFEAPKRISISRIKTKN